MSIQSGFRLEEIVDRLGGTLKGDGSVYISQIASLASAQPGQIAFLVNSKLKKQLKETKASAVIIPPQFTKDTDLPQIIHPNTYAYYARVTTLFNTQEIGFSGIHPSVQSNSELPASTRAGEYVVIGKNVDFGENVTLYPGCVIGNNVTIGDDSILYPNVTVYDKCVIGKRAIIHSGVVIGSDGFGFAKDGEIWIKIPQIGCVIIGDDVEIGANTCVDRGALDDTVISNGVKLDNLIQVAHNVTIGEHSALAGCVGVAGSVKIGRGCTIGGAGMISGHLEIADGIHVTGASAVTKSLHRPGAYTGIFPLTEHDEWIQNAISVKRLTKLTNRILELEKKIEQMEKLK